MDDLRVTAASVHEGASSLTHAPDTDAPKPLGALTRLLQILDLFIPEQPVIGLEQVVAAFNVSQSTAYRYLRELSDAGLIASPRALLRGTPHRRTGIVAAIVRSLIAGGSHRARQS